MKQLVLLSLVQLVVATGCTKPNSSDSPRNPSAAGEAAGQSAPAAKVTLLNVSYDPTRELFRDLNRAFSEHYLKQHNVEVQIDQSHGGSSSQARAVRDGLEADVVTLALWSDVDAIRQSGLINEGWEERLPNRSLPYYSTIVFVVRKGNPKQIHDWPDLVQDGVGIVTPNPLTGGGAKLNFLAAWGSVVLRGGSEADALKYVTQLYRQVLVLDSGARGTATTFVQKGIGDVQLAWENEAHRELAETPGELEIIYPPLSIRAEPNVAVVDAVAKRHGTAEVARDYLQFLYTDEGQDILARHFYRPSNAEIAARYANQLQQIELFEITKIAGGWGDVFEDFFGKEGVYQRVVEAVKPN